MPFNEKLDNSRGPMSDELAGGGAVAAVLLCASSGAAPSAHAADTSTTALLAFTIRPKTRSFTRGLLARLARRIKRG